MFRVLTVTREYGSGGARIAQIIAGRLSWQLLDRALGTTQHGALKVSLDQTCLVQRSLGQVRPRQSSLAQVRLVHDRVCKMCAGQIRFAQLGAA